MDAIAEARGELELFAAGDRAGLRVVLTLPLRVRARVRTSDDEVFRAHWLLPGPEKGEAAVPFDDLLPAAGHPDYASLRARFEGVPGGGLGARILGGIPLLGRERKAVFDRAATVEVEGDLPGEPAWGFHAALEVASVKGILRAYGANLADREVARLALRIEELIAGGKGDFPSRLVATSAPPDSFVPIRGEEAGEAVPLPNGVAFLLLVTKNLSPLRVEPAPDSRSGSTQAASFLEALRRLGKTATPEGLRVLGSALREALPTDAEGETTRLHRSDGLGPEKGVFGAAAIRGSGSLLLLVDSRGESAVRDFLAGSSGIRLLCRVGKVPA